MSGHVLRAQRNGGLAGEIGPLALSWDRSGRLSVGETAPKAGREPWLTWEIGAVAQIGGRPVELDQGLDGNARFTFLEEGPERLALRVQHRLYDAVGVYHGDGLHEAWAYANGDLYLAFALSFADLAAHDVIRSAWVAASGVGIRPPRLDGERRLMPGAMASPAHASALLLHGPRAKAVVAWHATAGQSHDPRGPASPWTRREHTPPYYERWGDLYEQWPGNAAWDEALGAGIAREGAMVRWYWRRNDDAPAAALVGHRALLRLRLGADTAALLRWANAQHNPLTPNTEGLSYRYWSALDGSYRLRHDGASSVVARFPADPLERVVHLCVHDLPAGMATRTTVDGQEVTTQTISLGGRVDDPLGAVPGRVDAGHAPTLTDPDAAPGELIVSATLHPERPTEIALQTQPGATLSYQRWDARRQLALTSSWAPGVSLGQLSLWDGILRRLRRPGADGWGIAQVPLYWFTANALTPLHYVNELERLEVLENGPKRVRLIYRATNANRRAESVEQATIEVLSDALRLTIDARLRILERWDTEDTQYLNLFPSESIEPARWHHERVLLMDTARELASFDVRQPPRPETGGNPGWQPQGDLFMAQFPSQRGNILVLATELAPSSLRQSYQFCIHWLDSHFIVSPPSGAPQAGDEWSVRLEIALAGDASWHEERLRQIGRRSLAAGALLWE